MSFREREDVFVENLNFLVEWRRRFCVCVCGFMGFGKFIVEFNKILF